MLAAGLLLWSSPGITDPSSAGLEQAASRRWIHGAADCRLDRDPPFEVFRADADTYILRQNKCLHFEAPFIYVLFGTRTMFVQDTGGAVEGGSVPLFDTLQALVKARGGSDPAPAMLVAHSHSHRDHTGGDAQFRNRPGVTLVEPRLDAVIGQFKLRDWPRGSATLDLGARTLHLIPTPGHQKESLTVYDERTGWLLTGDTLYPGLVYVKQWRPYAASVQRLADFARQHPVRQVMGTHVEMSRSGALYPVGSTFQPDEVGLGLPVDVLFELEQRLRQTGGEAADIVLDRLVVKPLGPLGKALGAVLKALGG